MLKFKQIFVVCLTVAFVGCHSTKPVVRTSKDTSKVKHKPATPVVSDNSPKEEIVSSSKTVVATVTIKDYVLQYKDIAMNNMKEYGIPASIILAQGILESGAGKGKLALTANNHFGIKCHKEWTGESVNHDDDAAQECFRKYKDPSESYRDHALFLTSRPRYSNLFQLPKDDYKSWATMLKQAGYATDPKYPQKLISYVEKYELQQYDAMVLGTKYEPVKKEIASNPVQQTKESGLYEVQKGDTLYSISKKFNLSVEDLKAKNNFTDNILSIGQKLKI
ncbi:MAG: glucosaminidase domain-containing protein [Flavobacterium sp.]